MDKKIIVLLSGCILAVFLLAGCGNDEVSSEYNIEYLNKDKTKIVDVPYEPEASDTDGMIKEFLAKLSSDSDNVEYRKPIPNGVEVTDYSLDGVMLSIHFDADYSSMTEVEEVPCCGGSYHDTDSRGGLCIILCGRCTAYGYQGQYCRKHESGQFY